MKAEKVMQQKTCRVSISSLAHSNSLDRARFELQTAVVICISLAMAILDSKDQKALNIVHEQRIS